MGAIMNLARGTIACLFAAARVGAIVYNTCSVPPTSGLSITKYFRQDCRYCQSIAPKIEKILNSIEKAEIQVVGSMIDTEACHAQAVGIDALPTVVVQKNGHEVLRFSGDKDYEEIADLIAHHADMPRSIFAPADASTRDATELLRLSKKDFSSGFSGPWIVYFEDGHNPKLEEILLETYKTFGGQIKIAKYTGADKEIVAGRYYIYDFPGILVIYDGILMRYNGELKLSSFHEFCTNLVEPSFKEIDAQGIAALRPDPVFVVFYTDKLAANRAFRRIAHDLKMNAKTYKSKVEAAGEESILRLAVFKNGAKFYFDGDVNDEGAVREWLFHAHFPNLSKLSMDNFYSIFHGLKPVAALVTDGGNTREISEFEEIALHHNRGASSSSYVFTFIDRKEYPKFSDVNFGRLHGRPLIAFFDPERQTFFGERILPGDSIETYFSRALEAYKANALSKYTKEKPLSYKWFIIGAVGVAALAALLRISASRKRKIQVE